MSVLSLNNVSFSYGSKKVLSDISFQFEKGKMYAIMGQSGAGKTTLLSLLSGLAKADSGEILYEDKNINEINRYDYRSRYVGVVFQNFNLLTKFTAAENIELSMDISGIKLKGKEKREQAYNLLSKMGLEQDEADRRILKLSGGQQQRVAIARAISYTPEIILADEPTGNLDEQTQEEIMEIFKGLRDEGKCVIIVTHSQSVARKCDKIYQLVKNTKKQ